MQSDAPLNVYSLSKSLTKRYAASWLCQIGWTASYIIYTVANVLYYLIILARYGYTGVAAAEVFPDNKGLQQLQCT